MKKLTRIDMKSINGGVNEEDPGGGGPLGCLGCTTDKQCAKVNKGKCTKDCNGGKGCSDW